VFDGVIEDVTELRAAEAFQTRLLGSLAEGVLGWIAMAAIPS